MVSLFIRLFVPDSKNLSSPAVRRACGAVCSLCGIAINLLLFAGKLLAGIISGSLAVTADAINNLSDAGSSIVTLLGFRLAAEAPDEDHPFGHGRFEYISGMVVSVVILMMGLNLLKTGINKIVRPDPIESGAVVFAVLGASILLKLYMAVYNTDYGKKINSPAMRATALDSLSDCGATAAVLISAVLGEVKGINIDGWAGTAVSLLIIFAGVKSLKETVDPLLGHAPDKEFIQSLEKIVMAHPEAEGIHDLAVHDYGPGRIIVSLHVEVDGSGDIYELHEAIDDMEREIAAKLGCEAVIHMDPVSFSDRSAMSMSEEVRRLIRENIDPDISIHDFRLVPGTVHSTAIFDCAVPPRLSRRAASVKKEVEELVGTTFANCRAIVKIDISIM